MRLSKKSIIPFLVAPALFGACSDSDAPTEATLTVEAGDYVKGEGDRADSSVEAVFVNFEFHGEVFSDSSWNPDGKIEDQLLYTIGQLNGDRSVGRIDKLELTNVTKEAQAGGYLITYDAKLLVAWGKRDNVPQEYELILPRDISRDGQEAFTEKYSHDCVDFGAHDVTSGSMWYYYRPHRSSCHIAAEDLAKTTATVSVSDTNTSGKYPEYHKVWEDKALKVVAVFGKYEDDATSSSDAGIAAYNKFITTMNSDFRALGLKVTPNDFAGAAGVAHPDVSFSADLGDGRTLEVVALLVDNIRTADADFDARYEELSGSADLIAYNGHAGLGSNIRAMARKGRWEKGQYAIVFINGCDTYAYVDSALADAHSAVNDDDPNGTKYLDTITNARPSFFSQMANSTSQLIQGLLSVDDPKTFEAMFKEISSSQVILVSGEEDNTFVPGQTSEDGKKDWKGMEESGAVEKAEELRFSTSALAAGKYVFEMTGDNDADLYVRVGNEPTTQDYDCRPYKSGSKETCEVEIPRAAELHVMVRGYATSSNFELKGRLDGENPEVPATNQLVLTNTDAVSIPDNDIDGVTSVLETSAAGRVGALRISMNVEHTFPGDVQIELLHNGKKALVFDGANTATPNAANINVSGQLVSEFVGSEIGGEWSLRLVDAFAQDSGRLVDWSLSFVVE